MYAMAFSDPEKIIRELNVTEGSVVADLGAGSGFYTMAAAKAVGPGGRVYAVEIQQDLLARLKANAHQAKLHNIEVIHGNLEKAGGSRLKDNSVDLAIAANVLFQVEDRAAFLAEAKRALRPGGRMLVVDWMDSFGGMGPQPERLVPQPEAKRIVEEAGFSYVTALNAGAHHYGLIFRKS